jgi:hypothetical protein
MEYLRNLWLALINKPNICIKEQVIQVPFSIAQVDALDKLFPLKRIGNTSVRDLLINEGQRTVIDYIKNWGIKGGANAVSPKP